jgi:hypothetical protein
MSDIMTVIDAAKKIMRQSGNIHQWGEGYPSEAVIAADMEKHGGYLNDECSPARGQVGKGLHGHSALNNLLNKLRIHLIIVVFISHP